MYTVTVTLTGADGLDVALGPATVAGLAPMPTAINEGEGEPDEGPSPIAPEPKELLWGLGAFLVLLVAMRLWLVPKVKQGMASRYGLIRGGHERADSLRAEAQREVAEYEQALAVGARRRRQRASRRRAVSSRPSALSG